MEKIEKLNSVKRSFKSSTKDIDFNDFIDAKTLYDDIKFTRIKLDVLEKNKMDF